jgi:hypothetical protein
MALPHRTYFDNNRDNSRNSWTCELFLKRFKRSESATFLPKYQNQHNIQ